MHNAVVILTELIIKEWEVLLDVCKQCQTLCEQDSDDLGK